MAFFLAKKAEISPRPFGVTMADFFPPLNTRALECFRVGDGGFSVRRGARARFLGQIDVLSGQKSRNSAPPLWRYHGRFFSALKYKRARRFSCERRRVLGPPGGQGAVFRPDWRSSWPKNPKFRPDPLALSWPIFPALKYVREGFRVGDGGFSVRRGARARFLGQIDVLSGQKAEVSPRPLALPWPIFPALKY